MPKPSRETSGPPRQLAGSVRYIAVRLCLIPVSALVVMTLSFFFVNLVPSDPVAALLGNFASASESERVTRELGLDQPLLTRYGDYMSGLFHGTLGTSYYESQSVLGEIGVRVTSSLLLVMAGFVCAWLLGVGLGVLIATGRGAVSRAASGLVSLLQSVPDFVVGLLGAVVLYFFLGLVPAPLGQLPLGVAPPETVTGSALVDGLLDQRWDVVSAASVQLVLPVLALAMANSVVFARTTASTLAETLKGKSSEHARALGVPRGKVVLLAMRASLLPTIACSGLVLAHLIGGVAIIEQVFNWQGLGQWGVTAVLRSDLPVVQGFVAVVATLAMCAYFLADIAMFLVDPRVRREKLLQGEIRAARRAKRREALGDRMRVLIPARAR